MGSYFCSTKKKTWKLVDFFFLVHKYTQLYANKNIQEPQNLYFLIKPRSKNKTNLPIYIILKLNWIFAGDILF